MLSPATLGSKSELMRLWKPEKHQLPVMSVSASGKTTKGGFLWLLRDDRRKVLDSEHTALVWELVLLPATCISIEGIQNGEAQHQGKKSYTRGGESMSPMVQLTVIYHWKLINFTITILHYDVTWVSSQLSTYQLQMVTLHLSPPLHL